MELHTGTLLNGRKYKIIDVLGRGGFGITYLGEQIDLNRKVAIKEFFMRDFCERDKETSQVSMGTSSNYKTVECFRDKFIKEAQTIAQLNHPHIISIYDIFVDNNTAYYVMEYLPKGSLESRIPQDGMSEQKAIEYIHQVASALSYIHKKSINHLDIKPSNILIDDYDNLVLIDFGLAKHYDKEGQQTTITPVGTSHGYAPIEQYKNGGVSQFSPATDIYALGATLYKMLTGKTPPETHSIIKGLPTHLLESKGVSPHIIHTISQAMQAVAEDRLQSIEALLDLINNKVTKTYEVVKHCDNNMEITVPFNNVQPTSHKEKEVISSDNNSVTNTPTKTGLDTRYKKDILQYTIYGSFILMFISFFLEWRSEVVPVSFDGNLISIWGISLLNGKAGLILTIIAILATFKHHRNFAYWCTILNIIINIFGMSLRMLITFPFGSTPILEYDLYDSSLGLGFSIYIVATLTAILSLLAYNIIETKCDHIGSQHVNNNIIYTQASSLIIALAALFITLISLINTHKSTDFIPTFVYGTNIFFTIIAIASILHKNNITALCASIGCIFITIVGWIDELYRWGFDIIYVTTPNSLIATLVATISLGVFITYNRKISSTKES